MNKENLESLNFKSPMKKNAEKAYLTTTLIRTPELKTGSNCKSPPSREVLKKSKRRDCTPEYSPNKAAKLHFLTEIKENMLYSQKYVKKLNFSEKEPKNKFLSLIEESINEVNEHYFDALGSQTTPNTLFKSLFSEKEEKLVKDLEERPYSLDEAEKNRLDLNFKLKELQEKINFNNQETFKEMVNFK